MKRLMMMLGILWLSSTAFATAPFQMHLQVRFDPATGLVQISDKFRFQEIRKELDFQLASDLKVSSHTANTLTVVAQDGALTTYHAVLNERAPTFQVIYSGVLRHPEVDGQSDCMIGKDAAVLLASCAWYPRVSNESFRFTLETSLPQGWSQVSEGFEISPSIRMSEMPQEGLNFVAAPFSVTEAKLSQGARRYRIFLRGPDPELAQKFLYTIPGIIDRYEKMFGPYPYREFNVVENLYETGYGMAGFTLLGSQVLRFPFLLNSSFPHEILHNWWGNGVYVNYGDGNWSEGLTTYLADHYEQELQVHGADYRLKSILTYLDYAATGPDFPLRKFVARHSAVTQAVGYSKSMMFFHQLRLRLGDEVFFGALKKFYREYLHERAGFTELERVFQEESGQNLHALFAQWIDQTGAPTLRLESATKAQGILRGWGATLRVGQSESSPYDLSVPVRIVFKDGKANSRVLNFSHSEDIAVLDLPQEPVSVELDPNHDLLRELGPSERPVALSSLFSAKQINAFVAPDDSEALSVLKTWAKTLPASIEPVTLDHALKEAAPALILGDTPEIRSALAPLLPLFGASVQGSTLQIGTDTFDLQTDSFAMTLRPSSASGKVIVWIKALPAVSPEAWATRLLHYGSSSALVFEGQKNVLQKLWAPVDSPLRAVFGSGN